MLNRTSATIDDSQGCVANKEHFSKHILLFHWTDQSKSPQHQIKFSQAETWLIIDGTLLC